MFCPRCGQQIVNDARFCSKCRFILAGVTRLLASDGIIEPPESELKPKRSLQQKGVRGGAKLIFLSVILFPLALALGILVGNPWPLIIPATIALFGGSLVFYAKLFWEPSPSRPPELHLPPDLFAPNSALPLSKVPTPGTYEPPRRNTADMVERPSVVEHTTKLLDQDPQ
ncbi:MAG TPA: zinc ribbon domain-containing protein [Blastocatellia bacterium]|nr:zinc ribbon domain-containing protein [Blastocatellia bacterium]